MIYAVSTVFQLLIFLFFVKFYNSYPFFVYPACPVKFFAEDERSGFNWGSSGRWYWGDFVAELLPIFSLK